MEIPKNLDAEQATLGAFLVDENVIDDVSVKINSNSFYENQNKLIFEAIMSLHNQKVKPDTISVINELQNKNNLERAGGYAYVAELTDTVPTVANIEYYIDIINDCAMRRDIIKICQNSQSKSYNQSINVKELLDETEKNIVTLTNNNLQSEIIDIQTAVIKTLEKIDERYKNKSDITGIESGFKQLDNMTHGFQKTYMNIIAARPSIGKTAFALSMIDHIVMNKKMSCGLFSLEMQDTDIVERLFAIRSNICADKMKTGKLDREDSEKLKNVSDEYNAANLLHIVDKPNIKLLELRSLARQMKLKYDVKIIFIDYIGLIRTENENRPVYEKVGEISGSLKSLARELDIPIVALSQVSRDAEKDSTVKMSHIRGSGDVEQDADVVMMLERPEKDTEKANERQEATCTVSKNRNGRTGIVNLMYIPEYTQFANKISVAD